MIKLKIKLNVVLENSNRTHYGLVICCGHSWLTKKERICWICTYPQAIQDVDEFVSLSEQIEKFSITSLAHQLILFSEWVSKHTPRDSSSSNNDLWSEKLHACNKLIHHQDVFNFKPLFPAEISIQNIAFSSIKVISGEKYAQIKHHLQVKTVQNMLVDFDVKEQQEMDFLLEEAIIWILDSFWS